MYRVFKRVIRDQLKLINYIKLVLYNIFDINKIVPPKGRI